MSDSGSGFDFISKISQSPWYVIEDTSQCDEFGHGPVGVAISLYDSDTVDAIAWMQEGNDADAELIAKSPEMVKLLDRLVGVDWCIGYEMTTEQMVEFDDIRTRAYYLLRDIQERLRT